MDLKDFGVSKIESYFAEGSGASIIFTSILIFFLTILLFLLVNWTFVLLVSLFSAPFSEIISGECERVKLGKYEKANNGVKETMYEKMKGVFKVLKNEVKKILLILLLMLVSFLLSFIPPFTIVAPIISFLLIAIQFLDYNWSRHDYDVKICISDLKAHFFTYLISGGVFFICFSIPYLNIVFIPYGIVYYSVLWQNLRQSKI